MIEAYQPTLFIDETETVLKDNEDLRGLIDAGHTRDSAYVWRSVAKGDDFEPKRFTVWSMKAIAGINAIKLAETVTSRAIVFQLRRKLRVDARKWFASKMNPKKYGDTTRIEGSKENPLQVEQKNTLNTDWSAFDAKMQKLKQR